MGEERKRKGDNIILDEEEEERMEEFYALLRQIKATKDHWRSESNERKKKKMKMVMKVEAKEAWTPSFEWEDFKAVIEFNRPLFCPGPSRKEGEIKEVNSLDLNLSPQ
ncbi:hypothetical protein MRB53_023981 [Persea americana]|uniref:Uncharacterized protein n=1 Tax=Persea americana TaxID=3435 RepID=A0ACC2LC41_PERAE|nr:hypothetical protein MRB53_023981 [Persea americana]